MNKPWYTSKTLWLNALAAGLVALEATTGMMQPYLPANFYLIVAVGLPVLNAILRVITTQAITRDASAQSTPDERL